MKITRALLWLSLLVAVSCENSTDTAVSNSKNYNQENLKETLQKLLKSVSTNNVLIEDLARSMCSPGSITALQKLVDANQLVTEGKIADVKSHVNSISSAILKLEGIVIDNQVTTDAEIAQLTATIKTNSDSLTSLIKGLETTINGNQVKIEAFVTELKTKMDTIFSSLKDQISSLESTVLVKLGSIETRLSGIDSSIKTISDNLKNIFDVFVIPTCKTPGTSGVYTLLTPSTKVYCEMITLDGGWLVIQQRADITFDFNRVWSDYRNGFGDVGNKDNFWLGLENLYKITSTGQYELAIEFKDNSGPNNKIAQYTTFAVGSEATKYRLTVGGYVSGGSNLRDFLSANSGAKFSTSDSDNDSSFANCAQTNKGGWWYTNCGNSDLNSQTAPTWNAVKGSYSRMMIRRK